MADRFAAPAKRFELPLPDGLDGRLAKVESPRLFTDQLDRLDPPLRVTLNITSAVPLVLRRRARAG